MNRKRFMYELEKLLKDLPANEREEAIQYYNDYFDDAGAENEARVIEELGSPEQVAATIREGMADGSAEYTEHGYEDPRFRSHQDISAEYREAQEEKSSPKKNGSGMWKFLCIVLLCILLCPIVFPLGVAVLAVAAAVIIGVIGIGIGAVVAGLALPIAGIATIIYGIYKLFLLPAVGIALGGIGCLLLAAGILICLLVVWIFGKAVPWLIRGLVSLIRYPLRKAGIVQ